MKMKTIKPLAALLSVLLISFLWCVNGCDSSDNQTKSQVIIFAAASTTDAINTISANFARKNNIEVVCNFASSSVLAQQIESGAEADIFLSANQKWADYLAEKNYAGTRTDLLANTIVIIVPADSTLPPDSADILFDETVVNIAMGDPAAVPVGKYGKQALTTLGLWDKIESKVSAAKDVRSALAFVETKAAEAGIVYSTDAAISDKVKIVYQFPDDSMAEPVTYPAMTLANALNKENAKLFFEYLKSNEAREVFNSYGFITK